MLLPMNVQLKLKLVLDASGKDRDDFTQESLRAELDNWTIGTCYCGARFAYRVRGEGTGRPKIYCSKKCAVKKWRKGKKS